MDEDTRGGAEAALLRRVAAGDREAFAAIYQRYQRPLFCYAVRLLRDERRAEEVTHEVFLAVWRAARAYRGESAPSTWIFGIAHHKLVSELRRARPVKAGVEEADALADPAPGPLEAAEAQDLARILKELQERLSPEHREVLQLTYYQGFSIEEAATVLGCPANTVKTRMFYARQRLKELLLARGVTDERR